MGHSADGGSCNNCTIVGGNNHILFDYNIIINDIVFQGITFKESYGASISAWGNDKSYASFLDCHWMDNLGCDTIDILYQENYFIRSRRRRMLLSTKSNDDIYYKNQYFTMKEEEQDMNDNMPTPTSMTIAFNDCAFTVRI